MRNTYYNKRLIKLLYYYLWKMSAREVRFIDWNQFIEYKALEEMEDKKKKIEEEKIALLKDNKALKEENEKLKLQVKEPHLLFIKTIWMTENKTWFYIFRNTKDNNYELRLFNLAWAYPLSQTFDTIEWAEEYAEYIKPKD